MKICLFCRIVIIVLLSILHVLFLWSWESKIVYRNGNGKLVYISDAEGNRIPDFSYAGYQGGGIALPSVAAVKTISPVAGDNTSNIQNAINEVKARTPDNRGVRGAVMLLPGNYRVAGTLTINESGVILRGSGQGADSLQNSIIIATGDTPHQRTVIIAGGGSDTKWNDAVSGTQTNILTDTVFVGEQNFLVQDASKFAAGDNIILYHPCTSAWLAAVKYGETDTTGWTVGEQPIVYNRRITGVQGNMITIDAPVFNTLNKSLSQSYIYKTARTGIRTNIGIENLRIDIEAAGKTTDSNGDENHAWDAIRLSQIEDAWVKNCTMLHFGQSGVKTSTANRITVDSCSAIEPISIITGERRYNFNVYTASQAVLFRNCFASFGRHDFVSNGTSWTSGCVFLDCRSENAYASSEGHRRWTTGLLFDNISFSKIRTSTVLGLYCRGDYGTSHGWALAHSVAWNCAAGGGIILVQKPPTAQNYAIGCSGTVSGTTPPAPFARTQGYIEGTNTSGLTPRSLYEAQLEERRSPQRVRDSGMGETKNPEDFYIFPNYPNPYNAMTNFRFSIPDFQFVTLKIFDLLGKEKGTVVSEFLSPGMHQRQWDASGLSSGVYFYRLNAGRNSMLRSMIVLK
jgi:hypothetical protein